MTSDPDLKRRMEQFFERDPILNRFKVNQWAQIDAKTGKVKTRGWKLPALRKET